MLSEDGLINALMKWAALKRSADAEALLDMPWKAETARLERRAYRAALGQLKKRSIFKSGHLFSEAEAAFAAHLKLRNAVAELDPSQLVGRVVLKRGLFTYFQYIQRGRQHDEARH